MKRTLVIVALFGLSVAASARAGEKSWYFGAHVARTNITFESKTDLEAIVGSTNQASGSAWTDGEKAKVEITVPADSLRTGIDSRDGHLQSEMWLDAKKHPTISFKAEKGTLKDGTWTLEGAFTMHGVAKTVTVAVEVKEIPAALAEKAKLGPGEWMRARTSFDVKLSDHGVKIPDFTAAKVSDTVKVTIDLFGTTEKPKEAGQMPESKTAKEVKAGDVKLDGEGVRYKFGTKPQLTNVTAESKADLETIIASSSVIAGVAAVDAGKGLGKVKLVVPVKSLKTGIELRDEHLRSAMWLDAEKTPDIVFESTKVSKKEEKTWTVEGTFTMHGITKALTVEVSARVIPAELVQKAKWGEKAGLGFRASFKVKLSDHGVKIPEQGAGKLQDEWTVTFDAVAIQE